MEENRMTFKEVMRHFSEHNKKPNWTKNILKAVIVFTEDSFTREYSEESRSYEIRSDNNTFRNSISNSLFGYCLDGTDQGVRLDAYMKFYGNEPGWKVDYCYLVEE